MSEIEQIIKNLELEAQSVDSFHVNNRHYTNEYRPALKYTRWDHWKDVKALIEAYKKVTNV